MIPENQLQGLTPHQARVQKSLEKIHVPAWYKPAAEYAKKSSETHIWRRGETSRPGWRRDSRTYPATSRPTTPSSHDNSGCSTPCMPYKTSYTRWSTNQLNHIPGRESYFTAPSPSHSSYSIKSLNSSTGNTYKQPYLGWRSQDRLNGVSCISTPAQRLAVSTIRVRHVSSSSQARVTPSEPGRQSKNVEEKKSNTDLHDSIKKVTNAIDDYCKTSTGSPHKKSRRKLSSKGTFQGLLTSSSSTQQRVGRQVWLESSFLTATPARSHQGRQVRGEQEEQEDFRLEDQIF